MSESAPFSQWVVVELFGHQRIAGLLSEQTVGGCHFLRVDVPESDGQKAYTKLYGQGAIYAINFVEEKIARELARKLRPQPVHEYELSNLLPAPKPLGGGYSGGSAFRNTDDLEG